MKKTNRKCNLLSEKKREIFIKQIITFFKEKQDQEIGVIAAGDILDFFLQSVGEDIYNKGVENSKELIKDHFENLEINLDLLLNK